MMTEEEKLQEALRIAASVLAEQSHDRIYEALDADVSDEDADDIYEYYCRIDAVYGYARLGPLQ